MNFELKSRKLIRLIVVLVTGLLTPLFIFWGVSGSVWTQPDFQALDLFYRLAVKSGHGPKLSPRIVYVTITDETYAYFGKNILDRADMARVNSVLNELGVEAVAYDIIFARPSNIDSDRKFAESINELGSIYLPMAFAYSKKEKSFKWGEGIAYERFRSDCLRRPVEKGAAMPFYATRALMQSDSFAEAAFNFGHISAFNDSDGVSRHVIMLLKVGDRYFPTLSLAIFLDYARVPFNKMIVDWGKKIVIPAIKGGILEKDVVIPIDDRGRAFIPFAQKWDKGFKKMGAHGLLQYFEDKDLRGNLSEFFEGNFVFIGDISVGTSDLGQTSLEPDVPLIITHTSMLNGMLTNTFYHKWSFRQIAGLVLLIGILLGVSALPRSSWILYGTGGFILAGTIGLTWLQFVHFSLFPVVTVVVSFLFIFFGLIAGMEVAVSRERAFIKNAFSRYVPEGVVNQLLANPELLHLGGDERVITVLFSDIENFTSISEKMAPPDLAGLLNEYLTEMTDLVLDHGGIIDKYEGDAIMAEYGAPLPMPDHADKAVRTGLKMQGRLKELREKWGEKGLPEMRCRIGINTGPMIIGNMGSDRVFDYTVIGDAVNLASRLEGANKRYNTYLMISEFTHKYLTPGMFSTRVLDVIKVKGKKKAVKVFEVCGETSEDMDPNLESFHKTYHTAFEAYLARDFVFAREKFTEALSLQPDDPTSKQMLARIDALNPDELPADWDGSVALTSK